MRLFWLNGCLCAEPETPVESEALLILARSCRYDLPDGHCEDGRQDEAGDSGACNGSDIQL